MSCEYSRLRNSTQRFPNVFDSFLVEYPLMPPRNTKKGKKSPKMKMFKNLPKPRKMCLKVAPNQRQSTPDILTQKGFDLCFPSCS